MASDTEAPRWVHQTGKETPICAGVTTAIKPMGISAARFLALATRQMPWKDDAYLLALLPCCGIIATTHV